MGCVVRGRLVGIGRFDSDAYASGDVRFRAADDGDDATGWDGQPDGSRRLRAYSRRRVCSVRAFNSGRCARSIASFGYRSRVTQTQMTKRELESRHRKFEREALIHLDPLLKAAG